MWHHVDMARDTRSVGRLATSIAIALMGKHKPIYNQSMDVGDYVVVTNCQHIISTGNKMKYKKYYRHSGRPGNLHITTQEELMKRKGGGEVLRKAVSGMLPKNRTRPQLLARLKTFEDSRNPYADNIVAFHDEAPGVNRFLEKPEEIIANGEKAN
jgi:large subunit ribosomal protein L13